MLVNLVLKKKIVRFLITKTTFQLNQDQPGKLQLLLLNMMNAFFFRYITIIQFHSYTSAVVQQMLFD